MIRNRGIAGLVRIRIGSGLGVGLTFLALAAFFLWGPEEARVPETRAAVFSLDALRVQPRRKAIGDPPEVFINGYLRTCNDCHMLFPSRDIPPEELKQHKNIVLDHGINRRCLNCHDKRNRDRLALPGGPTISFDRAPELCGSCHGPTYKDWQRGMHGKTLGYWDRRRGVLRHLLCTECHDPHRPRTPAMDPLKPLPPPDTLRMGAVTQEEKHKVEALEPAEEADPLRRAILRMIEGSKPEKEAPPGGESGRKP